MAVKSEHAGCKRVQVELEAVSERSGGGSGKREAAMAAYVTFRMTLAGHTGLLSHQFYCCPRGHHITHTRAHPHSTSLSSTPPPDTRTNTSGPIATQLYLAEHTRGL